MKNILYFPNHDTLIWTLILKYSVPQTKPLRPLHNTKTSKFFSHSFSQCNSEKLIRTLEISFFSSSKWVLYEEWALLNALSMGLVILIVCGFQLFTTMWFIINCLVITFSRPVLVFRMLLFKLKLHYSDTWQWLGVSINFRTNESSWYLEICIVLN